MTEEGLFILPGLVAGLLSGLIGIGGGVIIVPALLFFFGFSQHQAQGTTLVLMVPPIGLPAAWTYYKEGNVNFEVALLICAGFFLGGFVGAKLATGLSNVALERIFGVAMLVIGVKMLVAR
ncbi:MAG: sulfite exporter TauE/SafE family protein [Nitrospira sp.]|nr:sulfite exporter TauE/SafE family protein [Nitrospira sp.]MBL8053843.1 sulfite exporter TauE/SafE family protein [Nitrospira sp.]